MHDQPTMYPTKREQLVVLVTGGGLAAVLVGGFFIGIFVAMSVIRVRAGTGFWYGLRVFGPGGFGPTWVGMLVICSMFWPITLAVWLARGRPEPRIVFNEKALERQRLQAAGD